jgi:hypothetical protein
MKTVLQVAMSELRLIRTIERIELLKNDGRWSFRQPKKQRGVGGLVKSHWDHLMDEVVGPFILRPFSTLLSSIRNG